MGQHEKDLHELAEKAEISGEEGGEKEKKEKKDERVTMVATAMGKERYNILRQESGLGNKDFFEAIVNKMWSERLEGDIKKAAPSLQKHFSSDLSKLSNAIDSVKLIFEGQMRNIMNEKSIWEQKTADLQATILDQVQKIKEMEGRVQAEQASAQQLLDQNIALQEQTLHYKDEVTAAATTHQQELEELAKNKEDIILALRGQLDSEQQRLHELQNSLAEVLNESRENKEKAKEVDVLEQQVIDLQNELKTKEAAHQQELIAREKAVRDEFAGETKAYREEIRALNEDIRSLTKTAEEVRKQRDKIKAASDAKLDTLRDANRELEAEKEKLARDMQQLQAEKQQLENQLAKLKNPPKDDKK